MATSTIDITRQKINENQCFNNQNGMKDKQVNFTIAWQVFCMYGKTKINMWAISNSFQQKVAYMLEKANRSRKLTILK